MVTSSLRGLRSTTQGPQTHHHPNKHHQKSRGSETRRHSARLCSFNVAEAQASRRQVTCRRARQCHEPVDRDIASFPGLRLRVPLKRPISSTGA